MVHLPDPISEMPRSLEVGQAPRDLGPGEVEKMFGPAKTPRQRLERRGIEFVESETRVGVSVY